MHGTTWMTLNYNQIALLLKSRSSTAYLMQLSRVHCLVCGQAILEYHFYHFLNKVPRCERPLIASVPPPPLPFPFPGPGRFPSAARACTLPLGRYRTSPMSPPSLTESGDPGENRPGAYPGVPLGNYLFVSFTYMKCCCFIYQRV